MGFNLLPLEIKEHIASFITPNEMTRDSIKDSINDIKSLASVNTVMNAICQRKLSELKEIYEILNKYSAYQEEYENPRKDYPGKKFDAKGNPQLYDALLTGYTFPFARSSFKEYNKEIESDIKRIVKLMPQSLNCVIGTLKRRNDVTPLFASCINENIPVHIVEFLLEKGANPNNPIKCGDIPIFILSDLEMNVSAERFSQIKELLLKYGYRDVPTLFAACFNENISVDDIEFLLKRSANPNNLITNGITLEFMLRKLEANVSAKRFSQIKELFLKYG